MEERKLNILERWCDRRNQKREKGEEVNLNFIEWIILIVAAIYNIFLFGYLVITKQITIGEEDECW